MKRGSKNTRFGVSGPRSRTFRDLTVDKRLLRPSILIVCEGERTEPAYFNSFGVAAKVHGTGMSTLRLVEEARTIWQEVRSVR